MALTDDITRSFFDLWHHLDPVGAARFDPLAPRLALATFDRETVREHLAAVKALAGAAEALEPTTLDDEIDQTLLLDALRGLERTFGRERPQRTSPGFWILRLCETLVQRAGDDELLAALPGWCADAGIEADVFRLETGLLLLHEAGSILDSPLWTSVAPARLERAKAALEELRQVLIARAKPAEDDEGIGIGEAAADWRLHYGFSLGSGSAEALRSVARMAEQLEMELSRSAARIGSGPWREVVDSIVRKGPPPTPNDGSAVEPTVAEPWLPFRDPIEPDGWIRVVPGGALEHGRIRISCRPDSPVAMAALPARYGSTGGTGLLQARATAVSELRRRFSLPGLVEGWCLFAEEERAADATPETEVLIRADLYHRSLVAAVDLGIHRRQLDPAEGAARLAERFPIGPSLALTEVRRIVLHPMEVAGSVLVWKAWKRLASEWPGGSAALRGEVFTNCLPNPVMLRWHHGLAE